MREPLKFFVAGLPKGQPRLKARQQAKFIQMYTPGDADDWKSIVRLEAGKAWRANGYPNQFVGPVCVNLTFYFPRPQAHYRANGLLKPNAPRWHVTKPDRDNSDKAVLDALTNLCIWTDDMQVCDGRIMKLYADNMYGCLIEIKEADPFVAVLPDPKQPQLII
jgi:Holliday junction resolvase RusA-like endonuclease